MNNKRRNRRTTKVPHASAIDKFRANMKLAANVTEEQDWYLDTPDVRLTRIFMVVLLLHAVAIGGVVAFKMVDKASDDTGISITQANTSYETSTGEAKELAAAVTVQDTPSEPVARERPNIPAPLARNPNADNEYKVMQGDKLTDIASQHGVSPQALRDENHIISDNELYAGRVLRIPTDKPEEEVVKQEAPVAKAKPVEAPAAKTKPVDAPAQKSKPAAEAATSAKVHVVQRGDTAWGIASKHKVSFNELMKLNGITSPETLQIGQQLRLP